MQQIKIITSLLIYSILLHSCAGSSGKEKTISISGAFALYSLVVRWSEEYKNEHPDVRFNISGGGAGKGMADALAGAVDLGMFSRDISSEEKDKGVWWVGLTIDAVVPTVSNKNPFLDSLKSQGLTKKQATLDFIKWTLTKGQYFVKEARYVPIDQTIIDDY